MGIEELKSKIQKNVKGIHCDILSKSDIAKINDWIPTPHYDLNRIWSGDLFKGVPEKTLNLLVGPEASFKSSFMCLTMSNAQKQGYTPIIIDTEGAWTDDFVNNWGLDPDNMIYIYAPFVDEVVTALGQILNDGDRYIIGIDSIGNLEDNKLEKDITKVKTDKDGNETKGGDGRAKADQGMLQKKIKRMLKILLAICKKQKSIGLLSGHYYGSPNSYGSAEEIGGGKHMRLAPHVIISLKKSKLIENDEVIGTKINAITLKNRFYPAFQTCNVHIDYHKGINKFSGLDKLAIDAGFIEKKASWFINTVTNEKVQGSSKIGELIDDEMLNNLNEHVKTTGYSTVDKKMEETLKEADEIIEEK